MIDDKTGEAVAGAWVTIDFMTSSAGTRVSGADRPAERLAFADSNGQFRFSGLNEGSIVIAAGQDGYMRGTAGASPFGESAAPISLSRDQRVAGVTIRLCRFAVIAGRVDDDTGDPVAGVSVHLLWHTAARRFSQALSTTTDDRGRYRFWSIPPGRYVVAVPSTTTSLPAAVADEVRADAAPGSTPLVRGTSTSLPDVSAPGFRVGDTLLQVRNPLARAAPPPSGPDGVLVYPTTFYPAARRVSDAQEIVVDEGDERTGVDLSLSLARTVSVSGAVRASLGTVSGFTLNLISADAADWTESGEFETATTTTDARGGFTFLGVPPGQYAIQGTDFGFGEGPGRGPDIRWVRSTTSVEDQAVTGLTLTAFPGLRVAGRLRAATSRIVPAAEAGTMMIRLAPLNGGAEATGKIDADGRFAITGCLPGRYAVDLDASSGAWTVESATASGHDLLREPLVLGADVSDVVISLTDRPAEIAGTVGPASGSEDAFTVVAFPVDYRAAAENGLLDQTMRIVTLDASRRFALSALPPGEYLLAALPTRAMRRWPDARMMDAVATQASRISLSPGARQTIALQPIPTP